MRKFGLIILLCAVASSVAAQKPKPIELGFKPERTYDFNGLDNVNRFNGNVIITIPLGLKYPVSSNLNYGLTLIHNSKLWDFAEIQDPESSVYYTRAHPNMRSNAGPGWRVSMGRLFDGDEPTAINPTGVWMYESPSGGEHEFTANAHDLRVPVDENATVQFTTDGSNLRMVKEANGRWIEFPNGEKHWFVFESDAWRLKQISDQFDNLVTISYLYDSSNRVTRWTITDEWRSHTVEFISKAALGDSADRGMTTSRITMRGVADENGAQRNAVFDFVYTDMTVPFPCHHDPSPIPDWPPGTTTILPMLTGLNMPDGTTYAFDYHTTTSTSCEQGLIKQLTLPTGGTMAYTYGEYRLYAGGCEPSGSWNLTPGVKTRSVDGNVWTYFVTRGKEVMPAYPPENPHCPEEVAGLLTPIQPVSRWVRNSVVGPNVSGNRTRSDVYFHAWPSPSPAPDPDPTLSADVFGEGPTSAWPGETEAAKAPPATGWEDSPDISAEVGPGELRWLAEQTWTDCSEGGDCSGGLLRSTYRLAGKPPRDPLLAWYENMLGPWTPLAERVVYEDDSGCGGKCWSENAKSDFDRLGRPRVESTSSNFPDSVSASTGTTWKVWTTSELMDDDTPWSLGPYTAKTRTVGTESSKSTFCFNAKGQILRNRTFVGAAEGPSDIISAFTYTNGDVFTEATHGGHGADLDTDSDLCTVADIGTPRYLNRYTWDYGVFAKSEYLDPTNPSGPALLVTQDFDVSSHTGSVTKSRDPAGVATDYVYDVVGRVEGVRPAGRAWAEYDYALTSTPPSVTARQCPNGQTVCTSSGLTESVFFFDPLGRVMQERSRIPDSKWAATWLTFDAEGRKKTASVPVEVSSGAHGTMPVGTAVTSWSYDALGRVKSQILPTLPVNSTTTFDYTGARAVARTASIQTATGLLDVTTTETFDGLGRLVAVTEDATDSAVATFYKYDEGDRLTSVTDSLTAAQVVQTRSFDYDGAGLLKSETHPESGTTTYSYDARGHVTKQIAANGATVFSSYDDAERLLSVIHNGIALKSFTYDTSANGLGKIATATRINDHGVVGKYTVKETFDYEQDTGRVEAKTTEVVKVRNSDGAVLSTTEFKDGYEYDQLGANTSVTYPECTAGCGTFPLDRTVANTYSYGLLRKVPDYTGDFTYHPSGLIAGFSRVNVNGTVGPRFEQGIATNGFPRPASINVTGVVTPPEVTTGTATSIGPTGATLNATVNPNGSSATTSFEYGTTVAYGSTISAQQVSGTSSQPVFATVSSLACETTYHFRAKATIPGGYVVGADATFDTSECEATPPPTVTTGQALPVGQSTATLNGTVNPNGSATTTSFEYGTSASYGNSVSAQALTGSSSQPISASLSSLVCNTMYYYRAKASNGGGPGTGFGATFETLACPAAPTVTTSPADPIGPTSATLNGFVNPNGGSVTTAFDYGPTDSYGSAVSAQPWTGSSSESISAPVSNLTCNTNYHFRARATNEGGTPGLGTDLTFTTAACTTGSCAPEAIAYTQFVTRTLSQSSCNRPSPNGTPRYVGIFEFAGAEGDVVQIDMTSYAFNTFLYLRAPNGNAVAWNDNWEGLESHSRVTFTLTTSGTWTIDATTFNLNATGSYDLSVFKKCVAEAITPPASLTRTLTSTSCSSSPRGQFYFTGAYTFSGVPGQTLTIDMSSSSFDTYLYLVAPDGWIENNDDISTSNDNSRIIYVVPSVGTWTIYATTKQPFVTGSYQLSVVQQNCPTAEAFGNYEIPEGGSQEISANLTGTPPWTVTWSNGEVRANIQSSPATLTVSPQITTHYTVTSVIDSSGCSGDASGETVVTVVPPAPTQLSASATTASSVQLAWSYGGSTGGDFLVERCSGACSAPASWSQIGTPTGQSFVDGGRTANTSYLYRVRARKGGTSSVPSTVDVATTVMFGADVVAGAPVDDANILQLRTAVQAMTLLAGLSPPTFTGTNLADTLVLSVHLSELRTAMTAARANLGLVPVSYSPASLLVRAIDINELRGGAR